MNIITKSVFLTLMCYFSPPSVSSLLNFLLLKKSLWRISDLSFCCCGREIPSSKSGLCLTLGSELSKGDTRKDRARDFTGKGCPGYEQRGRRNLKLLYTWLPASVLGFMGMGHFLGHLWLVHSDLAYWCTHCSAKMDSRKQGRFWEVDRTCGISPFDLFPILPVGGGLLVPCSFLGLFFAGK